MKVSVVGTGYVGLITGVGLASLGHSVECVDVVEKKVAMINAKKPPIFEEGLQELLDKAVPKHLRATTDLKAAVLGSEITFICVGTPCDESGKIDLRFVKSVSEGIGRALAEKKAYHVVVVKSTVVPGTTDSVVLPVIESASGKKAGLDFGVAMNPEFLREGKAVEDFFKPDRIVLGSADERALVLLEKLYEKLDAPKMRTTAKTAEMVKYASNSFLATKISFINELGNLCKILGIDTYEVAAGMGLDRRISPHFLNSGCGYGGSCFGKDVSALETLAREKGFEMKLLRDVMAVNKAQPIKMVELLKKRAGTKSLAGKRVAVLGLAFKEGTDDLRDSPAIPIMLALMDDGAKVYASDPKGLENARREPAFSRHLAALHFLESPQEAIDKSEFVLLVTDWKEFRTLEYGDHIVIDGKNVLPKEFRIKVKNYEGICW
ncbi:MAG: UDP-glucose/GDP-mannose dehydrogenase family protein [Candidatus Micrarchaeia archaeon]|jgi:UDPglucose 6-dehydrogenase